MSLPAHALIVTKSASGTYNGQPRAATATFAYGNGDCEANTLCITLQNSLDIPGDTTDDANDPTDLLTGLFFDILGLPIGLSKVSATAVDDLVTVGSGGYATVAAAGTNVGAVWAYKQFATAPTGHSGHYGIAVSGLGGTFGSGDLFCTPGTPTCPLLPNGNGGTTSGLGGVNFGILPVGDVQTTGSSGFNNNDPYQRNKAKFKIGNLNLVTFNANSIFNVTFQYGSALNEGITPEPASLALLGVGMAGLAAYARRRAAGK
ncbi:MAG: PEP-CTERM sorting domain-containing protein [Rhodocyclaceae bacterium]|nr:PEP-CTERM sorting domain-containing protein [Rhodocyclaceae bacterium]